MPSKDLDTRTGRYTVAFRLPPEAGAEEGGGQEEGDSGEAGQAPEGHRHGLTRATAPP